MACNVEIYKSGLCGKPAKWQHTRYPDGQFCDDHKCLLEKFFKNGWSLICECKADSMPDKNISAA